MLNCPTSWFSVSDKVASAKLLESTRIFSSEPPVSLAEKKKHLSCVITRLENHHHSNFYQAASILCWVKFTRTFKLSPDSTWDMIKTEVASRIQTSIEDSKQKRNLTEILLFCIPVVPFLICSFKQYFWSVFGQGLSTVQ